MTLDANSLRSLSLALALSFGLGLSGEDEPAGAASIEIQGERTGPPHVSVGCDRHPAYRLLRELAKRTGFGFRDEDAREDDEDGEASADGPRVTVDLVRRPLGEVVEIVAGAAGRTAILDRGTIVLLRESANDASGSYPRLRDRAIETYRKAIVRHAAHPRTRRAHIEIGRLRETDGDREAAAAEYRTFVEEYPDDAAAPEARYRYARVLAALGRADEARAQLLTLVEFHPSHAFAVEATLELAISFESSGNEYRAIEMLREVACGGRASAALAERALVRWVRLHLDDADPKSAIAALDEGEAALGPGAAPSGIKLVLRAEALLMAGLAADAIAVLALVPASSPDTGLAQLQLGRALRKTLDPLGAIAALKGAKRAARDIAESLEATLELGGAYEDASLFDAAQALFLAELEGLKGHRFARNEISFALASSFARTGSLERARQLLTELKREPGFDERAAAAEADCLLRQGDAARAMDSLLPLMERESLQDVDRSRVAELLARALVLAGKRPLPEPPAPEAPR